MIRKLLNLEWLDRGFHPNATCKKHEAKKEDGRALPTEALSLGGSVGSALPSSFLASCFLHVALGWNPLSSHSRFSNWRIIERSYGRAAGLPAGFLGGLVCDLSGVKGEIIANQPNISFSCLRLEPGSRWVSWVVGLLGGTQGRRTQSLSPLSLGPSGRPWRPGGPGVHQASNTLNSNVIFHSHLNLISIAVMFTKDGVLFYKM